MAISSLGIDTASADNLASVDEFIIDIGAHHFDPPVVYIRPRVTVTWFSEGDIPRGVRGDRFKLSSPPMRGGKKFSRVFDRPGGYE